MLLIKALPIVGTTTMTIDRDVPQQAMTASGREPGTVGLMDPTLRRSKYIKVMTVRFRDK